MPRSYDPLSGNMGGQLFHMNLGLIGKLDHKAAIAISRAKGGDEETRS
jgi:hypothetical protein